ncbi:MAG: methyl-accepting chemotaxis protein [Vampirovibrionales bacterium]
MMLSSSSHSPGVMSSIFDMGIKMMNRLTYSQKFWRVATVCIGSAVFMTVIICLKLNEELTFTWKEQQGCEVLQAVQTLIQDLQTNAEGGTIKADYEDLKTLMGKYSASLAYEEQWRNLDKKWRASEEKLSAKHPETQSFLMGELFAIVDQITINSNLILDPAFETYYLMDSATTRQLQASNDLVTLAGKLHDMQGKPIGLIERSELQDLMSQLKGKIDLIKFNTGVVKRQNDSTGNKIDPLTTELSTTFTNYQDQLATLITSASTVTPNAVESMTNKGEMLKQQLHTFNKLTFELLHARLGDRNRQAPIDDMSVLITLALANGVVSYLLVSLYQSIIQSVGHMKTTMKNISEGDLTQRITLECKDELTDVAHSANKMVEQMGLLVRKIQQDVQQLNHQSKDLLKASEDIGSVASMTTKIADTSVECLDNVAVDGQSVEQVTRTVVSSLQSVNENMQTVSASAEEMSASVTSVATAVEEMNAALGEISRGAANAASISRHAQQTTNDATEIIHQLEGAATDIGSVVSVIKTIASQTSLLALNATIEAASAGEAGQGFAVVANEVKSLAKQAGNATEEIRDKVEMIQRYTRNAVEVLGNFGSVVRELNEINATIAAAVEEQTATVNEICHNINGASDATHEVAQNIQSTSDTANSVSGQAKEAAEKLAQMTTSLKLLVHPNPRLRMQLGLEEDEEPITLEDVQKSSRSTMNSAQMVQEAATSLAELSSQLQEIAYSFKC